MFLIDGEVVMEDLFIYFIRSSAEDILLIEEDCEIQFFFRELPLKILN